MSASASAAAAAPPEFWLLKLPNFLHEQWEEAKKANLAPAASASTPSAAKPVTRLGEPIAHILIEKRQPKIGQRKMKLVVPTASTTPSSMGGVPTATEFSFQTKPKSTMLVFGPSVPPSAAQLAITAAKNAVPGAKPQPPPEAFKLEGEVTLLADCMPRTDTQQYHAAVMARMEAAKLLKRTTQMVAEGRDAVITPASNMIPLGKRKDGGFGAGPAAKKTGRLVRSSDEIIEQAVLTLMSRPMYAYITIAKLAIELQQPLGAISDMVKKLCIRQEEGLNKGMYTLKPEYKLATDNEDVMEIAPPSGGPAASSFGFGAPSFPQQSFPAFNQVKAEPGQVKREM